MGVVSYAPGCVVSLQRRVAGGSPIPLPKVLHADTTISLAPSVGTCNLTIADPDGQWVSTIKPNDGVNVTFTSRAGGRANLGQLTPGAGSAWSGLVNSAVEAYDPRTQYGRAVKISASTLIKPLAITAVPLQMFRFFPLPGWGLVELLTTAIQTSGANISLTLPYDFSGFTLPIATPVTVHPNMADINDPEAQSWMAYLASMIAAAGVEFYAREDGTLILRDFQATQNPSLASLLSLPDAETFASSGGGVSDVNLITNAAVTWGPGGSINNAVIAPDNGLLSIGPLPPQLTGADGRPLDQIGKRFVSYTADFLNSVADAKRYAGNVRSVGMAGIDVFQASVALNGDVRIGTAILAPRYDRRYYVTTVGHYFEDQVDAQTDITGNYGVPTAYAWNQAAIGGTSNYPLGDLLAQLAGPAAGASPVTTAANLPAPADASNPDVRWPANGKVISVADIQRVLGNSGSPLLSLAPQIWSQAQQYGVNPAFAVAVWQEETSVGLTGVGRPVSAGGDYNPGSVTDAGGGFVQYLDYPSAIGAWFALLAGPLYIGGGNVTVSAIGAIYAPTTAGQNTTWVGNVVSIMNALIATAQVPAVATSGTQPAPQATGSVGAMAGYAGTLAQSIPTQAINGVELNNVIVPGTPLGDYARKRPGNFTVVECTTFVEYLLEAIAGIAGIVGSDGTIHPGPNASQWGGYLGGLGFSDFTGTAPLPGQVLLYTPGERNGATGIITDLSSGYGHVGVITTVTPPDTNGRNGSVTVAAANVPDPVDQWSLTAVNGLYTIGGLVNGGFFGATPFAWWGA